MTSRWFIFWMSLFIIYSIKNNIEWAMLFLFLAMLSTDPIGQIEDMLNKKNKK